MLGRIGWKSLALGVLLAGTPALAQQPLYVPRNVDQVVGATVDPATAGMDGGVRQTKHSTECAFDAYAHFDESGTKARKHRLNWRHRNGCDDCNGGHGRNGDDPACDFACANCFAGWDIEKRFIYTYAFKNAHKRATNSAYGDGNSGQAGIEWMLWPINDGDVTYSRWGFTTMFDFTHYDGNRQVSLVSRQNGNFVTIQDGKSYSFVFGPTYRVDFELLGLRLSPNATVGCSLDWVTVRPVAPAGLIFRNIDAFKNNGFDAGAYIRLMIDVPITDRLNFSIGGDFKYSPSDVMVNRDEARKHMGFVIGINHEF